MMSSVELEELPPKVEEREQLTPAEEWENQEPNMPEPSRRTKIAASVVVAMLVIGFLICFGSFLYTRPTAQSGIILFIGDGFGPASATLARTMLNRSLALDSYLVGTVRTFSADSLITDSAAAATAYACGEKTNNRWVSVLPDNSTCRTLLEAAKAAGWRVGLIATTELTDATPAAFSAHVNARGDMDDIARQQLQHKVDIMIGGGKRWYAPLADEAEKLGVTLTADWSAVVNKQVKMPFIAALTEGPMPYMIDRPSDTTLPSLKECLSVALEYLTSGSSKPFFLMVEGSRIDHAGHANDPAAQWMEVATFDAAFALGVSFANAHNGVGVVSTADHETGGLTIGKEPVPMAPVVYEWHPEVVHAVKMSAAELIAQLPNLEDATLKIAFAQHANIELTEQETVFIKTAYSASVAAARVISARAGLGWATTGHTGVDVNLYSMGAAPRFHGSRDNTNIGRAIAALHNLEIGRQPTK